MVTVLFSPVCCVSFAVFRVQRSGDGFHINFCFFSTSQVLTKVPSSIGLARITLLWPSGVLPFGYRKWLEVRGELTAASTLFSSLEIPGGKIGGLLRERACGLDSFPGEFATDSFRENLNELPPRFFYIRVCGKLSSEWWWRVAVEIFFKVTLR